MARESRSLRERDERRLEALFTEHAGQVGCTGSGGCGADATPRPERFAACYHRNSDGDPQGGAVVYPADGYRDAATACSAIGFVPVKQDGR